jgi:hypothetical protein
LSKSEHSEQRAMQLYRPALAPSCAAGLHNDPFDQATDYLAFGWIEGDEARKTLSDLTTEADRALATAARSREGRQRSSSRLSNSRQAMRYRSRDRECPDRAR